MFLLGINQPYCVKLTKNHNGVFINYMCMRASIGDGGPHMLKIDQRGEARKEASKNAAKRTCNMNRNNKQKLLSFTKKRRTKLQKISIDLYNLVLA